MKIKINIQIFAIALVLILTKQIEVYAWLIPKAWTSRALGFSFIHIKASGIIVNTNVLLAILNLVPIYPLDGGRILHAIICLKNGKKIADEVVYKTSNALVIVMTALSSILILVYKNIGLFLIIAYLWVIVLKENKRYLLKKRINNVLEKQKNAWLFFY